MVALQSDFTFEVEDNGSCSGWLIGLVSWLAAPLNETLRAVIVIEEKPDNVLVELVSGTLRVRLRQGLARAKAVLDF